MFLALSGGKTMSTGGDLPGDDKGSLTAADDQKKDKKDKGPPTNKSTGGDLPGDDKGS